MLISRLARCSTLLAALALLPETALAKLPDPSRSTIPAVLTLVGLDQFGTADPIGEYTVALRDFVDLPAFQVTVVLDFSECSDDRFCSNQQPSGQANCPARRVIATAVTGLDGIATLRVVGHSVPTATPAEGARLRVYGDGVLLGFVRVAALDLDGGGMSASDLSQWLSDYFGPIPAARSDYDGDGALSPADMSLWMSAFFAGGSVRGGDAPSCP